MPLASEAVQNSFNNLFDILFCLTGLCGNAHVRLSWSSPKILGRSWTSPEGLFEGAKFPCWILMTFFHPFCPWTVAAAYEKSGQDSCSESVPQRQKLHISVGRCLLLENISVPVAVCVPPAFRMGFLGFLLFFPALCWAVASSIPSCSLWEDDGKCHLPSLMSFAFFLPWT